MNVYEDGNGDARQTDAGELAPQHTLFRKRYRALSPEEVALHDAIKDKADELAALIVKIDMRAVRAEDFLENIGNNRGANVTLAVRHLEDAVYRAVKALTS